MPSASRPQTPSQCGARSGALGMGPGTRAPAPTGPAGSHCTAQPGTRLPHPAAGPPLGAAWAAGLNRSSAPPGKKKKKTRGDHFKLRFRKNFQALLEEQVRPVLGCVCVGGGPDWPLGVCVCVCVCVSVRGVSRTHRLCPLLAPCGLFVGGGAPFSATALLGGPLSPGVRPLHLLEPHLSEP
uniref:Uncharacterized protein n=1 Tax=Terrapene triunguis TaxID=2587831 RepID=A0A674JT66_9SAUR